MNFNTEQQRKNLWLMTPLILVVFAIAWLAADTAVNNLLIRLASESTTGRVLWCSASEETGDGLYVKYSYRVKGRDYQRMQEMGSGRNCLLPGQRVQVLYAAFAPEHARLKGLPEWPGSLILMVVIGWPFLGWLVWKEFSGSRTAAARRVPWPGNPRSSAGELFQSFLERL